MNTNAHYDQRLLLILKILLIMFGLFMVLQVFRKVFGGSWASESLVTGLVLANISCTFTMAVFMARLGSDHKHLNNQFRCMAVDFKRMSSQFNEHRSDFRQLSAQFDGHRSDFRQLSAQFDGHRSDFRQLSAMANSQGAEITKWASQFNELQKGIENISKDVQAIRTRRK